MLNKKGTVAAGLLAATFASAVVAPSAFADNKEDDVATPPKIVIGDAMADITRVSVPSAPSIEGVDKSKSNSSDENKDKNKNDKMNWSSKSMGWTDKTDSEESDQSSLDRFISSTKLSEHADRIISNTRDTVNRIIDFILPSDGPISSGFGQRWGTNHNGIDFAGALGSDVKAFADGKVIDSGPASGFGNWIRLLHSDGSMTVYGHMSADTLRVDVGEEVKAGDVIASVGNEGFSTGPHLHFEYWPDGPDGSPVDPMTVLKDHDLL